jgi:hypothetical protein
MNLPTEAPVNALTLICEPEIVLFAVRFDRLVGPGLRSHYNAIGTAR